MTNPIRPLLILTLSCGFAGLAAAGNIEWDTQVAADNPTVWYQFNETSGTTADNSGSLGDDSDGTYNNGVALGSAGVLDGAIVLDGTNDSITAPTQFGPEITIEVVARSTDADWSDSTGGFASLQIGGGVGFIFGPFNATTIQGFAHNGSGFLSSGEASVDDIEQFHHFVFVIQNGLIDGTTSVVTRRTYIDGVEVQSAPNLGTSAGSGGGFFNVSIGLHAGEFAGLEIDEWVIYNSALSEERILAHAQAIPEPGALSLLALGATLLFRRHR